MSNVIKANIYAILDIIYILSDLISWIKGNNDCFSHNSDYKNSACSNVETEQAEVLWNTGTYPQENMEGCHNISYLRFCPAPHICPKSDPKFPGRNLPAFCIPHLCKRSLKCYFIALIVRLVLQIRFIIIFVQFFLMNIPP